MSTLYLSLTDAISSTNPRVIDDVRARKLSNDLKRCTYYETCATYGLNVERVFQDGKCPASLLQGFCDTLWEKSHTWVWGQKPMWCVGSSSQFHLQGLRSEEGTLDGLSASLCSLLCIGEPARQLHCVRMCGSNCSFLTRLCL